MRCSSTIGRSGVTQQNISSSMTVITYSKPLGARLSVIACDFSIAEKVCGLGVAAWQKSYFIRNYHGTLVEASLLVAAR